MGYSAHLPPRYVQLRSSLYAKEAAQSDSDTDSASSSKSRVRFNSAKNETIQVERLPKNKIWYNDDDYCNFGYNWKQYRRESVTPRRTKTSLVVGKRPIPPMEDFQTFQGTRRAERMDLVSNVIVHQENCRRLGIFDPDGFCMLSESLSLHSKRDAQRAGALNAYEVQEFLKEGSKSSLSDLFADYYLESIHPHLNEPLVYLSKIMSCEID